MAENITIFVQNKSPSPCLRLVDDYGNLVKTSAGRTIVSSPTLYWLYGSNRVMHPHTIANGEMTLSGTNLSYANFERQGSDFAFTSQNTSTSGSFNPPATLQTAKQFCANFTSSFISSLNYVYAYQTGIIFNTQEVFSMYNVSSQKITAPGISSFSMSNVAIGNGNAVLQASTTSYYASFDVNFNSEYFFCYFPTLPEGAKIRIPLKIKIQIAAFTYATSSTGYFGGVSIPSIEIYTRPATNDTTLATIRNPLKVTSTGATYNVFDIAYDYPQDGDIKPYAQTYNEQFFDVNLDLIIPKSRCILIFLRAKSIVEPLNNFLKAPYYRDNTQGTASDSSKRYSFNVDFAPTQNLITPIPNI